MFRHRFKYISLILLGVLFSGLTGASAQTACFNTPLAGTWINPDAVTKDLIKVVVVHECTQEQTKDGLIIPGSRWYVKAWAKCYPANCVWGRIRANIGPKGNLWASLPTYAADRFLKIKMSGDAIAVHLIVNYHDARRKDRNEKLRLIK